MSTKKIWAEAERREVIDLINISASRALNRIQTIYHVKNFMATI